MNSQLVIFKDFFPVPLSLKLKKNVNQLIKKILALDSV